MKYLYAPWRASYAGRHEPQKPTIQQESCPFCFHTISAEDDKKRFVIKRYDHAYIMLNAYPYNAGHLLIIPHKHTKNLYDLSIAAQHECINLVSKTCGILEHTLHAAGINVGINIAKAAGASVVDHLHIHVLPRFVGDTNFLPTIAKTKQISFDLHAIYTQIKHAFTHE